MKSKGFLLIDSLICVAVISLMSVLILNIYDAINNYLKGYELYKVESNLEIIGIYDELGECEKCTVEEDSFPLEQ